jgi:formate hydrogenlyase subunit 3/multisubunit Na+/H+ antiporter MnhD subunit
MSVLPFLAVTIVGAVIATLLRDLRRLGTLAGFGAVVAALAAACFVRPETPLGIGGGALAGSDHLRLVLTLCLGSGLLALLVARLATWQPSAPGALLGGAAGIGLALGLAGTSPGLLGVAAATIAASALALGSAAAPSRIRALARELRGATTSLVVGLIAAGIVPGTAADAAPGAANAEPAATALVLLGMALVVAHRFGAIPLHARVSRLADAAPSGALPILAAWLPAAWGLVILGWAPAALGPSSGGLSLERDLIVTLALVTLLLGTVAALIQDEVEHVVAYTIVADAGVALLALAALDPAARDAARAWVLVFATTRTAMIGWTIAFRTAFGSGRLRDTTGWLRRAPTLGVALAGILVASVGWPGLLAWDARLAILQSATAGPALLMAYAGSLGAGAAICRVLVIGGGRPSAIVAGALGELPRLPARRVAEATAPGTRRARRGGTSAAAGALARRLRVVAGRLTGAAAAAGRDARPTLELNRVPLRAFALILLAGLALLAAAGSFGIDAAARAPGPALPSLPPFVGG